MYILHFLSSYRSPVAFSSQWTAPDSLSGHAQEMSTLLGVNTGQEPDLVAMAAGAAGSESNGSLGSEQQCLWGLLTSLHPMVTADFFLCNDHIRHFQVSLKGEEVEMKLRGPEAPFN